MSSNDASSAYRLLVCFFVVYKRDCICHGIPERKLFVLETINFLFAQLQLKTAMILIKNFGFEINLAIYYLLCLFCRYCKRAKGVFKELNQTPHVVELDQRGLFPATSSLTSISAENMT